jgi:cytochrome c peroxidase
MHPKYRRSNGLIAHTQNPRDLGVFKVPSLKNVALRQRFMHDGSLVGLEAVIEHYNSRIQVNPNLDPHLLDASTGFALKMNLSNNQKAALLAFLETLTDYELIKDEKYSNPFKL